MSRAASPRVDARLGAVGPAGVALVGAGDPTSSNVVYAMVIGLVAVGVVLVLLGVWILRQTRPDLEVLAPLERMGDREWKKRDPSTQRRMLDELRPDGAVPLTPEPLPPPIDADFEADLPVSSFSDLGPGIVADQRDPTPVHSETEGFDLEPAPVELAPVELAPVELAPVEPAPVEPAPAEPGPEENVDDEALSDPRG